MQTAPDFRNTNALWCSVMVETLVRCGLTHAIISPGSRSAPMTMALARHAAIEVLPILDERSAAFFALGMAKRMHRPIVLVCTSGTAGANHLPAVVEAHESRTPLLVITADRPPELRDCASGQTIDQQKLFGGFVRFHHEFAVPEATEERLSYARQMIAHAYERAQGTNPGPVHLNMPFRDPLPPIEDGTALALRERIGESFFSHLGEPILAQTAATAWQNPTTVRGLIVAGPADPRDPAAYVAAAKRFAEGTGWPVLVDALSPLRHYGRGNLPIVGHYDAILRDERTARTLVPRLVMCLESWPTSKVLRSWLESSGAEIVLVSAAEANRDALHGRTRHLPLPVECLGVEGGAMADAGYRDAWMAAAAGVRDSFVGAFNNTQDLSEPKISWLLAQHLPRATTIVVASSMPVRDVEFFWPVTDHGHRFIFNRGANGIDGTLSTALGVAHGGHPTVLLTGDLALLHDTNGFLTAGRINGSLTIVLVNNSGGGIFEHLPVAKFDPPFESLFATPQDIDFAPLCAAYGVQYEAVTSWEQLRTTVALLPEHGVRVLEVKTNRKQDTATRKKMLTDAAAAAGRGKM